MENNNNNNNKTTSQNKSFDQIIKDIEFILDEEEHLMHFTRLLRIGNEHTIRSFIKLYKYSQDLDSYYESYNKRLDISTENILGLDHKDSPIRNEILSGKWDRGIKRFKETGKFKSENEIKGYTDSDKFKH